MPHLLQLAPALVRPAVQQNDHGTQREEDEEKDEQPPKVPRDTSGRSDSSLLFDRSMKEARTCSGLRFCIITVDTTIWCILYLVHLKSESD